MNGIRWRTVIRASIATLAFGPSVAGVALADGDLSLAYTHVKPALVKVWAFDAIGVPTDSGTGFVIQSDQQQSLIVTAFHVVAHSSRVTIDLSSDLRDVPATVVATSPEQRDLVVLRVERGNLHPVVFATRNRSLLEGTSVAAAGFFKFDERIGLEGQLAQLVGPGAIGALPQGGQVIEVNLDLEPGLSGAPLFDPGSGDIVGVVDTKNSTGGGGYAISAALVVLDFLSANRVSVAVTGESAKPLAAVQPQPVAVAPPAAEHAEARPAVALPPVPSSPTQAPRALADPLVVDTCFHRVALIGAVHAQLNQVIAACTKLISAEPASDPALIFLYDQRCGAYHFDKQFDEAIADCSQALRRDPTDGRAYSYRASDHDYKGEWASAVSDATAAIRYNRGNADNYVTRGVAYENLGQKSQAIADYTEAMHIDPNKRIVIHVYSRLMPDY